jgi:hypothetical protein
MEKAMSSNTIPAATAAFALSLCCLAAAAQDSIAALFRTEVKAETRATEKHHELLPMGDEPEPQASFVSTTTRAQVKAKTRAAARAHQLPPAGQTE